MFFNSGFYADMGLQWYYLFISIYGWVIWAKGERQTAIGKGRRAESREQRAESKEELKVSNVLPRTAIILAAVSISLFVGIRFILVRYTDSTIPGWDAFTTALSIVATWMLARKIIEHWYIWIIVNIVSLGLYVYKGLYPTVVLFAVYTVMAYIGLTEWRKSMRIDANCAN